MQDADVGYEVLIRDAVSGFSSVGGDIFEAPGVSPGVRI